jgi:TatD DNase family protein
MFIDSHCHPYMLDLAAYNNDFDRFVTETVESGVGTMLCVAVDMKTASQCIEIASQYPSIYASVGSHPSEKEEDDVSVDDIVRLASHERVIAIGETGLDYYYNKGENEVMRRRFRDHIRAALRVKKPLIIHTRDAREDTIKIMREENAREVGGVMHCFTETLEMAQAAVELGFYISFSGIVTFKNAADLQAVARDIPLEKILIETDAPYLAPMPYRGKQNEPKYVRYVAQKIADLKGLSLEEVARQTSENFRTCFIKP